MCWKNSGSRGWLKHQNDVGFCKQSSYLLRKVKDVNVLEGSLHPLQGSFLSYDSGKFLIEFARICLLKKEVNKTQSLYSLSSLSVRKVSDTSYLG